LAPLKISTIHLFTIKPYLHFYSITGVWGLGFGVWGLGFGVWARDDRAMARVLALVHAPQQETWLEAMRVCIVCGCALALIAAGRALPF